MKLSLVTILLASFVVTQCHPKRYDVIPKDSYKRQILQPIPGYIPVYIKTDEEPIIRSEIKNPSVEEHPKQGDEHKEKNSFKQADEKTVQKNEEQNLDKVKTEAGIKNNKNLSEKPQIPLNLSNPSENQVKANP